VSTFFRCSACNAVGATIEASPQHDGYGRGKRGIVSTTVYDESLTASDRCDRCGAQAYLRVKFESGGELLFCAHHAKAHSDKLRQVALKIHDETDKVD
jgi:hypothetical protein